MIDKKKFAFGTAIGSAAILGIIVSALTQTEITISRISKENERKLAHDNQETES